MTNSLFRFPVACALALTFAVVTPGTAHAGGLPECAFTQSSVETSEIEIDVDPAFFDALSSLDFLLENIEDLAGYFDPPVISGITFTSSNMTNTFSRISFMFGGEEFDYIDADGPPPDELAEDTPSVMILFAVALLLASEGIDPDESLDPSNYPVSYRLDVREGEFGEDLCSLTITLNVAGGSGGCKGPYGYLCNYLDRFDQSGTGASALPNTI